MGAIRREAMSSEVSRLFPLAHHTASMGPSKRVFPPRMRARCFPLVRMRSRHADFMEPVMLSITMHRAPAIASAVTDFSNSCSSPGHPIIAGRSLVARMCGSSVRSVLPELRVLARTKKSGAGPWNISRANIVITPATQHARCAGFSKGKSHTRSESRARAREASSCVGASGMDARAARAASGSKAA
jgi:hypothetical protein